MSAGGKIGVLVFGRKRPGFDQAWSRAVVGEALGILTGNGFEVVGADAPVLDDATVNSALDKVLAAGCKALIVVQPSIADGQYAFTLMQRWADPVILWTTPERPGDGKVSSCGMVGQHLFGAIYRQAGRAFELVYGQPNGDLEASIPDLLRAIALSETVQRLRRAKVGMVGLHAPGFIDLMPDPFLIQQTFGMQLHALSLPQFIERVGAVPEDAVAADMAKVQELKLPLSDAGLAPEEKAFYGNTSRFYLAIRELMAEASLDAMAVQCWPELPNMVGHWPYLAVSRISAEGGALSIEGDVDGAIGALIGSVLGIGPGFLTDWLEHDADTIQFWHPGMAPLDMCNEPGCEGEPTIGDHFNNIRPMVVDGAIRTGGAVTVTRLWRCDGRYHLMAFDGEALPPRRRLTGNTLLVGVKEGHVPERFERLVHAGMPHHVTVHFGAHAETLRRLARLLRLEWHG